MPIYYHQDAQGQPAGKSQSLGWLLLKWGPIGWIVWGFFVLAFTPIWASYLILKSNLDPMWKLIWVGLIVGIVVLIAAVS